MSILIKGMEMPESCLECPFKWAGDSMTYCLAQTPTMKSLMPVKLHEIRWKKFSNAVEKFRWKEASCPLVPVPPHGDLIDRDAIPYNKIMLEDDDFYYGVTKPYIDRMPTVIEVEGKE